MAVCTAKSILLRKYRPSRNRSGGVNKNGVASASVWDSVAASDVSADTGYALLPLVFGIQSTGRDPSFRNGKLCYLQAISSLDCGMRVKGTHERQFAYEAHTVLVF